MIFFFYCGKKEKMVFLCLFCSQVAQEEGSGGKASDDGAATAAEGEGPERLGQDGAESVHQDPLVAQSENLDRETRRSGRSFTMLAVQDLVYCTVQYQQHGEVRDDEEATHREGGHGLWHQLEQVGRDSKAVGYGEDDGGHADSKLEGYEANEAGEKHAD